MGSTPIDPTRDYRLVVRTFTFQVNKNTKRFKASGELSKLTANRDVGPTNPHQIEFNRSKPSLVKASNRYEHTSLPGSTPGFASEDI